VNKYKKPLIALILAATILSSLYAGAAYGFKYGISSHSADYVVFEGVAGNDYYDSRQYSYCINQWANETDVYGFGEQGQPFIFDYVNPGNMWYNASKSLRIGMTEFGEFATPENSGIAYGYNASEWTNTESWASVDILQKYWIQGWVLYINYTRVGVLRAIEGYALFSDTTTVEGARKVYSWYAGEPENPTGAPATVGAQLTQGSIITSGVQVLYDSARLAVGRTSLIIHDGFFDEDVAKITFTVVLNKDTKYAIIYKDVKILLDTKVLDAINDFAFSERYEIDLARHINPSNQAYIHWYEDWGTTVYQHPLTGQTDFDVVQAFNLNRNYIFYAAYWPEVTEYSVYHPLVPDLVHNITQILPVDTAVADITTPPFTVREPTTPWVIAQWRYQSISEDISNYMPKMLQFLAKGANREIRFVEVAGMTDYKSTAITTYLPFTARDVQADDGANYVDLEIQYLLAKVFNPIDDLDTTTLNEPYFMWTGVGTYSAAVDSAGASTLQAINNATSGWSDLEPIGALGLLDKAEPVKGSVPYGLDGMGNFANYHETFSNTGKATGNDATSYVRTGLNGFAFKWYDAGFTNGTRSPPQPIAGGNSTSWTISSVNYGYWYPSKDPLTERWLRTGSSYALSPYLIAARNGHPNGIMSVGGPKANELSRYFNDFNFAIDREGTADYALINGGIKTGTAPTSDPSIITNDFMPISTWASSATSFYSNVDNSAGYAVISVARDINNTRGLSVYGWDGRDTYWACAWAAQYLNSNETQHGMLPAGTVSIVLKISYIGSDREPTMQTGAPAAFTIMKALGTITEFGHNEFYDSVPVGFDDEADIDYWTGELNVMTFIGGNWWYAKIPTVSWAAVEFDP